MMTPEHGARFDFELREGRAQFARYHVQICTPDAAWHGSARIDESLVTIEGDDTAPTWARSLLEGFLRTLARHHGEEGDWPRLFSRWRAAPER